MYWETASLQDLHQTPVKNTKTTQRASNTSPRDII